MPLLDDFKARFPQIDTATADTYVPLIEPEYRAYYNREYNDANKEAILHLIAHFVVLESSDGGDGESVQPKASQAAGGVSESWRAPSHSGGLFHDMFSTTRYGQRFLMLIAHKGGGVPV